MQFLLNTSRMMRLATMLAMVFVLLAPSLASAFASPVLTDEQLLLRDVAASRCAGNADDQGGKGQGEAVCQHCILCRSIVAINLPAPEPLLPSSLPVPATIAAKLDWHIPAIHPHSGQTGPPRAPPSFS